MVLRVWPREVEMTTRHRKRGHFRQRSRKRPNGTCSWGIKIDITERDPVSGMRVGPRRDKWHT